MPSNLPRVTLRITDDIIDILANIVKKECSSLL